jgi:hypothetical protein
MKQWSISRKINNLLLVNSKIREINTIQFRYTVELGYNDHNYNEFTVITNKIFWSQMVTLLHLYVYASRL